MPRKKKAPSSRPSENALRKDFERYQKLVADLNKRYAIEPLATSGRSAPSSPTYTSEANFVYEIHART